MKKKLFGAGIFYLLGNIFDKAIAFITVPIFTRLLSPADYGIVTTYLSWASILSVVLTLSISESVRSAVIDFPEEMDNYLSSMFGLGTLSAVIQTTVICIVSLFIPNVFSLEIILYCCLQAYAVSMITMVQWHLVLDYRYFLRTITQSIPNMVIILLSIFWIQNLETDKYLGRILPNALVLFVTALTCLIVYWLKGRTIYKKEYWSYALKFSIPVIFHLLSTVVLSQANRTMILFWWDSSEAGLYGLAYQFGLIPLVMTTTLENLWLPWFTEKYSKKEKQLINQVVSPFIWISLLACIVLIMVFYEVLVFMVEPAYYGSAANIPPIIASTYFMFLTSTFVNLEYYLKETRAVATNTIIVAALNIVLNYVFIPQYGAVAASYSSLASYIVLFVLHYVKARQLDSDVFSIKLYVFPVLLMLVSTVGGMFLLENALARYFIVFICMLLSIYLLYKYYKLFKAG
ncbi:lipopolysaccharide biosynthesis protein [Streptococcus suis]|uniref:lipopolysaccharide biosynthesis protein n=1 Tax=Streptococcus suis TaxID=1307 RepID=UPI00201AFEA4|nr:oligosaccharide flippase family protein [Streptococcus suis]MCL4922340.1 oligosaccharide flippase family protein [Streptococcus suis]HEM6145521.1 oligosaccharide flippase family protein [Streptococcus suis]HEM6363751.1 oligosaccharide flippase family protein [Streptococcus suis]HEM6403603.1 oligosaccharide flippase family protein [Streptococcus suis]